MVDRAERRGHETGAARGEHGEPKANKATEPEAPAGDGGAPPCASQPPSDRDPRAAHKRMSLAALHEDAPFLRIPRTEKHPVLGDSVLNAVQNDIVPRLLAITGNKPVLTGTVSTKSIEGVVEAAVASEVEVIRSMVQAHVAKGASYTSVLVHLIGGAAASLGRDWESDKRDFMDVTIAAGALQQVVMDVGEYPPMAAVPGRTILLTTTPGETHTLGLAILGHVFRDDGWAVDYRPDRTIANLAEAVREEPYTVAGLSLSADVYLRSAARAISAIRSASVNRSIKLLVGGPAIARLGEDELARLPADALAADVSAALEIANGWAETAATRGRN